MLHQGFILIHGSCVAVHPSSIKAHNLAIWLLPPVVTITLFAFWQSIESYLVSNNHEDVLAAAWVINGVIGFALGLSCALVPRRPDVTYNGCLVDRQRTVSALSRYTWSWVYPLLRQAEVKHDLDMEDLPSADCKIRAENLKNDLNKLKPQSSLLRSLLLSYKGRLALLSMVTLLRCPVSIMPFWILLRILHILEDRNVSTRPDLELLVLIIGMAIFNLLDAVSHL